MAYILTLTLLILYTVVTTETCSLTPDYRLLKPKEVLADSDLVILARFISQDNLTTTTTNGIPRYFLTLNTQVDCILKNKNGASVGRDIKITEERGSDWDNINTCGENFDDIRFNTKAAIVLKPHYDRPSEFMLSYDVTPGSYFYLSGNNGMLACGFQGPTPTTGGSCANTLPQAATCQPASGGGRATLNNALVILVLFCTFNAVAFF